MSIKKYNKLKRKYLEAVAAIDNFQENCEHKGHIRVYRGNTGNYDPHMDSWWVDCTCVICEKYWQEDQ